MKAKLVLALAVSLLIGAGTAKAQDSLQGTWKLIGGEADGKALSEKEIKDGKLVIKGDGYTVTLAGNVTITGTEKLDSTKAPMAIDITDSSGANKGKTCLGIYVFKGDEFRVLFAPPGQPRPTTFATAPNTGQWMHVWQRVKE